MCRRWRLQQETKHHAPCCPDNEGVIGGNYIIRRPRTCAGPPVQSQDPPRGANRKRLRLERLRCDARHRPFYLIQTSPTTRGLPIKPISRPYRAGPGQSNMFIWQSAPRHDTDLSWLPRYTLGVAPASTEPRLFFLPQKESG